MLQGLDFLHTECCLIHTDLKPENVMAVIEDVEELVQACYTLEQMMCVSPSSANQVVAVPSIRRGLGRRLRSSLLLNSSPSTSRDHPLVA